MSEHRMRAKVVQALKPLHAIAVENPCRPGTPDINYVEGWIELKWLRAWPKRADSVVRLPHYSQAQRIWAVQRRQAGGQSWFLLQCGREWLLLDGAVAAQSAGSCSRAELVARAARHFTAGLSAPELVELLRIGLPKWTHDGLEFVP